MGSLPMTREVNRLLIVDDQPDMLEFVAAVAQSVGYQVACAENAARFRSLPGS